MTLYVLPCREVSALKVIHQNKEMELGYYAAGSMPLSRVDCRSLKVLQQQQFEDPCHAPRQSNMAGQQQAQNCFAGGDTKSILIQHT